jgi:glycoside/pentoside/hexuronide:cation symporter, GPH family
VLVGWALMFPRLFDAVVDPVIGHLSDITHTPWGRRRPFMFVTAILGPFLVTGLWWMSRDWNQYEQFSYLLVFSILLFLCWGTYSMNHLALGYELSDDYHLRTKVMAVRGFYFSCAALAGGWIYWLALRPFFGGEVNGIRIISIGVAIAIMASGLVAVFCSKERFKNANRKHVNLWHAIWATLHVRPFVILLTLRIIGTLGGSLYAAVAFYITTYSVCNNDKSLATSLSGYAGMAGFLVSFAMVPLAAKLSRLIGKRHGIICGAGAAFLSSLSLPLFARPGYPYLLLAHMIIFIVVGVSLAVFGGAVMPDICDIDELKSGERREGLFAAVGSFVSKIEHSVCILLGGYLVSFSGFDTHLASQKIQQPHEVLERLRWLGFTPAIIFSGLAFIVSFSYPVTQKMMEDVRAQLDARRKSAPAMDLLDESAAMSA